MRTLPFDPNGIGELGTNDFLLLKPFIHISQNKSHISLAIIDSIIHIHDKIGHKMF